MIHVYETVIAGDRKHRAPLPKRIRRRLYQPGEFKLQELRQRYWGQ